MVQNWSGLGNDKVSRVKSHITDLGLMRVKNNYCWEFPCRVFQNAVKNWVNGFFLCIRCTQEYILLVKWQQTNAHLEKISLNFFFVSALGSDYLLCNNLCFLKECTHCNLKLQYPITSGSVLQSYGFLWSL